MSTTVTLPDDLAGQVSRLAAEVGMMHHRAWSERIDELLQIPSIRAQILVAQMRRRNAQTGVFPGF